MNRRILFFQVLVILVAFTILGVMTAFAGSFTTDPLVQVSGISPFATCTADNVADQPGKNFLNSEVEPWVDINPTNSANIVGAWQQDRWSDGGARGLVAGVSIDGGASWQQVVIPGISDCSGGIYDRSTDPWVTFGQNGDVYQLALSFNAIAPPFEEGPGGDFDNALLASKSTDGGFSWTQPVEVIRDVDANVFNDKQSITADPFDSDLVYAVWDRLVFPPAERASLIAGYYTAAYRGPAWFARTTDGGESWEQARSIFDPGQNNQTIGNQIVVLPDGDLVNVFDLITIRRGAIATGAFYNVALIRSEDQGVTWGPQALNGKIKPVIVSPLRTIFVTDPDTDEDVRTGDIIPEVAVDPASGNLYIVWQDARFNGVDQVAFSMSTDGGFTWTEPIKVNQTPGNIPLGNQQAFTPSVDVAEDGTVAVTYYDFRYNTPDETTLPTDYFIVHCHADCSNPDNWANEVRLTEVSFDMRQAPVARGFFTGDYEGLASVGNDFLAFFSQTHASDPGSIFFRRAGP
jgi:hypothetical protein